jgi:hypothetical protein
MDIIDWPADEVFVPSRLRLGVSVPKSGWRAFFTGQAQTISHQADRYRLTVSLPACGPLAAGRREAFFLGRASRGDWVRLGLVHRPVPQGTLRGTPTVAVSALAGARTLQVQGVPGDTLLGGDALGAGGHLFVADYVGAVADGSGVLSLPLILPLQAPLTLGDALTWQAPTTTWQVETDDFDVTIGRALWQAALEVPLKQVF